ncbi:MAG TPA: dTDP-4-amino-4,6-dideoxygalactose transaminase [Verrucomicrobiae bacterium]|nr:dTDP-4-amino-4,6-dideoxygalactose transaminase [Verrucomicrobiae bacterium]
MNSKKNSAPIPFNKPHLSGKEISFIAEAVAAEKLAAEGDFTRRCNAWFEKRLSVKKSLLTHSCTAALEMAALLAGVGPGDEVILPSFTFVSTANAFVLRGAVPVFVDIRADTLNLDEKLVEEAITPRTKAIVPVHYGGVACDMERILDIAKRRDLRVIEDAAHSILATYKERPLGSLGDLGCLSFHETKPITSGHGGALLINNESLRERAEILLDRGTDQARFLRGEVDHYTWQDMGSCYAASEVTAAFLWGQLEIVEEIIRKRMAVWNAYHEALQALEAQERLRRPVIPAACRHNAHVYYVLMRSAEERTRVLKKMRDEGVAAAFHYVPLHSSPAGRRFGRASGPLSVTSDAASRLIRLPLWIGVDAGRVLEALRRALPP